MRLAGIECRVFRAPVAAPVRTSFGVMRDRPSVLVRVAADEGFEGWGEVWCNFPSVGAEHRARLLRDVVAPAALDIAFERPHELFEGLTAQFCVLAIQAGEPGPLAQVIAGLDMAVWDLAARRAGKPLHVFLGGAPDVRGAVAGVAAYASGLNPDRPQALATTMRERGHRAFKLKVGFGEARDLGNLAALRAALGPDARLMVDANQGWEPDVAARMARLMAPFGIDWLEEPIRADSPAGDWRALAAQSQIRLAAGENMRDAEFAAAIASGHLGVLQPDLGKWGGFSRCVEIGRAALAGSLRFCPHWLGGGVGLLASAHLLAAVGGDGMVEVDSNPNPLREHMLDRPMTVADGRLLLPGGPGLGATPDLAAIGRFEVPF